MTKPQQSDSSNNPKKQIAKAKSSIAPKNISVPNDEHTNERKDNSPPHQQIIAANDKSNGNARIANVISAIALVVSIALAWYTYQVFKLASSQKDSVKKSADASMLSNPIAHSLPFFLKV